MWLAYVFRSSIGGSGCRALDKDHEQAQLDRYFECSSAGSKLGMGVARMDCQS